MISNLRPYLQAARKNVINSLARSNNKTILQQLTTIPIRDSHKHPYEAISALDAVKHIESGDRIVIHGAVATPKLLVDAMTEHGKNAGLRNVNICHLHTDGDAPYAEPDCKGIFHTTCFFIGHNLRQAVKEGRASYMPISLSDIPSLFRRKVWPVDVVLVQVSPPDDHGYCSLGTSVDLLVAATQNSKCIIGHINKYMPRTLGDGLIHISQFDTVFYQDVPLPEHPSTEITSVDKTIGSLIADHLVQDGATLQVGIGNIPNAVLDGLHHHSSLGVHTEMISDGILPLVESGVITNSRKIKHRGKIVTAFCSGTRALYDFIDNNPQVAFLDLEYVNNPYVIAQQPKMTAINACLEIDLTGQVCSDSIGTYMLSGSGGQHDFLVGAGLNPEGRAILAVPSRTLKGVPKIVPTLKPGAGVVTPRTVVRYVVTEYGIATLYGKTMPERAKALIKIAHPDDREELERAAFERFKN